MGRYKNVVASALALLCWDAVAQAASKSAASKTPAGRAAGEEMILFQELPSVFGASKYEQKPSEAPASISIITADEIQRYGYRTLSEILRSVRGLFTTYDRNYSYIGARGFDRPGDYDTRILLLLDGHRVNDNVYDQASVGTESLVDVDAIDRVEVIRGPSSSLYGTDAFFAVINAITRSGRDLNGKEIAAAGGSYSTAEGRAAYGARLDNCGEVYLSGAYYDSGGFELFYSHSDHPPAHNGLGRDAASALLRRLFFKASVWHHLVHG